MKHYRQYKFQNFQEALVQMILSWIPMSESFRQRLSNYGRGKDNHHNEDVKSDAQGHKLNTYEDGEYGKLIVIENIFTNKY